MVPYIEWAGTIAVLCGALLSGFNKYPLNIIAFNIGSCIWFTAAYINNQVPLMAVNGGLILIYLFGIIRHKVVDMKTS